MADTLPLPPEARIKVYRFVFSGERLVYVHYLDNSLEDRASCVSILFVSKTCLVEARPVLLDTVQVNVTMLLDLYYASINSLVLKPEMLRHVHLSASGLIQLYAISDSAEWDDFAALEKCIAKMKNLKSLTFGSELDYGFDEEDPQGNWISAHAQSYIKNHPARMLGLDDDGGGFWPWPEAELCTVQSMVKAWLGKDKAFKLISEVKLHHYPDDGLEAQLGTVRLDFETGHILLSPLVGAHKPIQIQSSVALQLVSEYFYDKFH